MGVRKKAAWHYESRVKELESFALKVESGRVSNPAALEDSFGCLLVVPNYSNIGEVEDLLQDTYGSPVERRPPSPDSTPKSTSDFRFDDLRLYFRYRDQGFGPASPLVGTVFEIQVRTFLQHAWSIATHDVVYKTDDVSWRRERIAYQARAALEQVEVSIDNITALEASTSLPSSSPETRTTNEYIALLKAHWPHDELPDNVRLLAGTLQKLMRKVGSPKPADLEALLEAGRREYGGRHNLDWSPYRAVLQYVTQQHQAAFKKALLDKRSKDRFFVPIEILSELGLPEAPPSAVVLRDR